MKGLLEHVVTREVGNENLAVWRYAGHEGIRAKAANATAEQCKPNVYYHASREGKHSAIPGFSLEDCAANTMVGSHKGTRA